MGLLEREKKYPMIFDISILLCLSTQMFMHCITLHRFCVNDPKCSCIASHLHFNDMFMHFRFVITMLNCCVLVGLDWAKPMMFLSLHVTYSCIFVHTYL